ncbi:MAG: hypothetical protein M1837_006921 [Sclerophora amabilis]|nr:MAG: hypothetical protein M1837_006921 [Sclerophora amabilis]
MSIFRSSSPSSSSFSSASSSSAGISQRSSLSDSRVRPINSFKQHYNDLLQQVSNVQKARHTPTEQDMDPSRHPVGTTNASGWVQRDPRDGKSHPTAASLTRTASTSSVRGETSHARAVRTWAAHIWAARIWATSSRVNPRESAPRGRARTVLSPRSDLWNQGTEPSTASDVWESGTEPTAPSDLWEQGTEPTTPSDLSEPGFEPSTPSDPWEPELSPWDPGFRELVLEPRGIIIDEVPRWETPFGHFGTEEIKRPHLSYYQQLEQNETADTSVWLEPTDEFVNEVANEFRWMAQTKLGDSEYYVYAMEMLLKKDMRSSPAHDLRRWLVARMVDLEIETADGELWETPPVIKSTVPAKEYSFSLRSDCVYWLSLEAFEPETRHCVENKTLVMKSSVSCPYFSIEIPRKDSKKDVATSYLAAASAVALYNRYKLKQNRVQFSRRDWTAGDTSLLKHYGLILRGNEYSFWCSVPVLSQDGKWEGCRMQRLSPVAGFHREGVRSFVDWVNEIHRWGLTVHGRACMEDVSVCLGLEKGPAGMAPSESHAPASVRSLNIPSDNTWADNAWANQPLGP